MLRRRRAAAGHSAERMASARGLRKLLSAPRPLRDVGGRTHFGAERSRPGDLRRREGQWQRHVIRRCHAIGLFFSAEVRCGPVFLLVIKSGSVAPAQIAVADPLENVILHRRFVRLVGFAVGRKERSQYMPSIGVRSRRFMICPETAAVPREGRRLLEIVRRAYSKPYRNVTIGWRPPTQGSILSRGRARSDSLRGASDASRGRS
jgi:hypothetical protein